MRVFVMPRKSRAKSLTLAISILEGLPNTSDWRITIEPARMTRSNSQNAYLWAVPNKMIAEVTGYEVAEVHEYLLGEFFGWREKPAPTKPKAKKGHKSVPNRTTTTNEAGKRHVLTTTEFEAYVDFVQRFAAEKLGLFVPNPDPDHLYQHAA